MKRKLTVTLCIIMVLMSMIVACAEFPECYFDAHIYNCNEFVTLRSRPSTKAAELEKLYLGEEIQILSREPHPDGDWDFILVESMAGRIGYVLLNYVMLNHDSWYYSQLDDTYGIGFGTVTSKDSEYHSNLRSGPGTKYDSIGYLFGGEAVPYLGRKEKDKNGREWYCCEVDGQACWISSKVAKVLKP